MSKIYPVGDNLDKPAEVRNIASDETREAMAADTDAAKQSIEASKSAEPQYDGLDNSVLPLPETCLDPHEDRVIIFPHKAPKSIKGILLTEASQERMKPSIGRVVAVGPGKINPHSGELIPVKLKRGDTVMFGKYAGTEVKDPANGTELLIMRYCDTFARDKRG